MMQTNAYRMETERLSSLHAENRLGTNFPVGDPTSLQLSDIREIEAFRAKWLKKFF